MGTGVESRAESAIWELRFDDKLMKTLCKCLNLKLGRKLG